MEDKDRPGYRIRKIRVSRFINGRPMSLRQLEDASGVDRSYIGRIERGGKGGVDQPGIDVLEHIARGLGVRVEDIASPKYYGSAVRSTVQAVTSLVDADDTLSPKQKREAIDYFEKLYRAS